MNLVDAVNSVQEFSKMGLDQSFLSALPRLSISAPTQIQSQAMPAALAGQDLIAVAETGSGKTLAYALPILNALQKNSESRALVLAPTREVAVQIFKVFEQLCGDAPITRNVIIGGERGNKHDKQLRKNPRLVVATPGRLNDLLRNNKLLLKGLDLLVIDEADVMLDMGFLPQLKDILATLRGSRQTLMFSASFSSKVEVVAQLFMKPGEVVMVRSESSERPVSSLAQRVLFMAPGMKNQRLQDEINAVAGSVIVFTANQESCEVVGHYLREYAHLSNFVHAGLSQSVRSKVVNSFREGKIRILVTTDLLSRGLDVPSVDLVVNFDLPPQPEDFVHRIGRTARMGRSGQALTFVTPFEFSLYKQIKKYLAGAEELSIDAKFKFVGDTTGSVRPPRALKPAKSATGGSGKKKKKYGKRMASRNSSS